MNAFPQTIAFDRAAEFIEDDIVTLNRAWSILSQCRLALNQLPELETPSRRVSIEDLQLMLCDAIIDVAGEAKRLRTDPIEPVWERA